MKDLYKKLSQESGRAGVRTPVVEMDFQALERFLDFFSAFSVTSPSSKSSLP